jgi:trehalose 6-phosphate synthase
VVHLVFAYPSRQDLAEYREYTAALTSVVEEIDAEFATDAWRPVVLSVQDDFARSLAAMRIADVLVVNPIRDGMNLVAKEGAVLSDAGVAVLLSREAGAADDLGEDALMLNPYDVSQTAELLHAALVMDPSERRARTDRLSLAATALPPQQWFADQVAALD